MTDLLKTPNQTIEVPSGAQRAVVRHRCVLPLRGHGILRTLFGAALDHTSPYAHEFAVIYAWEADDLEASPVASWVDAIASEEAAQATGSRQPTWTADYDGSGYPAVVFDGSDDFVPFGVTRWECPFCGCLVALKWERAAKLREWADRIGPGGAVHIGDQEE